MEQSNKPSEIRIMANHSVQGKPLDFSFLKIQDITCKFVLTILMSNRTKKGAGKKWQTQTYR